MDYIELIIELTPRNPWAEISIAELAELGFESFVDSHNGFSAFIPESKFPLETELETLTVFNSNDVLVSKKMNKIPHQNWNALWEADFEPVIVSDKLAIIAPFHDLSLFNQALKIVIQPQMSFGTGHHQTTFLMSEYLMEMPIIPSPVLDMGTGTGVLAFLAEKLGGNSILAVDIEPWSVENTIENAQRNHCSNIRAICGDIDVTFGNEFGLILANINKNVLKAHMEHYSKLLINNGLLFLSGFFESDVPEMTNVCEKHGFQVLEVKTKETWAAIKLLKTK